MRRKQTIDHRVLWQNYVFCLLYAHFSNFFNIIILYCKNVTISDFHCMTVVAKIIHNNNNIAISLEKLCLSPVSAAKLHLKWDVRMFKIVLKQICTQ